MPAPDNRAGNPGRTDLDVALRLGNITGLTGGNAGASRTIDGFTSGQTVSVKLAFLSPIQHGGSCGM